MCFRMTAFRPSNGDASIIVATLDLAISVLARNGGHSDVNITFPTAQDRAAFEGKAKSKAGSAHAGRSSENLAAGEALK